MSEQQTLREAENIVEVTGLLSECELEMKTFDGKDSIQGKITIETGEGATHSFRIFVNKLKADGTENGIYKGMLTVQEDYKSIASHGREEADKVTVSKGKIGLEEYYVAKQLKSFPSVSTNFINRLKPTDEYNPKAEFEVEVIIHSLIEEIQNEEPTGRTVVKALIPMYGGKIIPFNFVVSDPEIGTAFTENYSKGDTVKLYGNLINSTVITETEEAVMIGSPKKKITKKIIREFEVTNGGFPYEEDSGKKYNMDAIKKAMEQREIDLEAKKNKSEKNSSEGASSKPASSTPASAKKLINKPALKKEEKVNNYDDLPF